MYHLIELSTSAKVEIKHNDKILEFNVEAVINRRLRDPINSDRIFTILNNYLDYKGKEFKDKLFEILGEAKNRLTMIQLNIVDRNLSFDSDLLYNILDFFDPDDVKYFIEKTGIIHAPKTLPDKFNESIEIDEKGSREQTYLKNDYIELITLITIIKSCFPVIGEYANVADFILNRSGYKEYGLASFFTTHSIFTYPAAIKLVGSISKLVERFNNDKEAVAKFIIATNIPKEMFVSYALSFVIIQKLLVNDELSDTDSKNTITKIYNFASNKFKPDENSNNFKIKKFSDSDSEFNLESESVLESFRAPSDITLGFLQEFKDVFSDIFYLANIMKIKKSQEEIISVKTDLEMLMKNLPLRESIIIASWVFKDILDPRAADYLDMYDEHIGESEIINMLTIAFLWLWEHDFKNIAMILTTSNVTDGSIHIANQSIRNKIDNDIKEKLNEIFPNKKRILLCSKINVLNL